MCHSIHVAVNTWLNCSFFTLIIIHKYVCMSRLIGCGRSLRAVGRRSHQLIAPRRAVMVTMSSKHWTSAVCQALQHHLKQRQDCWVTRCLVFPQQAQQQAPVRLHGGLDRLTQSENYIHRVVQQLHTRFIFCSYLHSGFYHFFTVTTKYRMHKNNIIFATSPVFCDHPTLQNKHYC